MPKVHVKAIKKTPYHSFRIRPLPKGCSMCVKGQKLVVFITGLCNVGCFYCPLSDQKKDKDVVYANEWDTGFKGRMTKKQKDIILEEARLCESTGAGITGGDPLLVIDRTVAVIKLLKKEFTDKFHIHLYTGLKNVTLSKLKKLYDAGLDEIRFHPLVWNDKDWDRIKFAREFGWDVGAEIPAIPGYEEQTIKLIDYISDKIDFLNLNELEISDTNANQLVKKGYHPKDHISYGVKSSDALAKHFLAYIGTKKYPFKAHYCTCRLKDAVQLAQRIKRRSKNTALAYDIISDEGTLIRGIIYLPETKPGFSYHKNFNKKYEKKLNSAELKLLKIGFRKDEVFVDHEKQRLIVPPDLLEDNAGLIKELSLVPAIVEEYPTHDAMELEVNFL